MIRMCCHHLAGAVNGMELKVIMQACKLHNVLLATSVIVGHHPPPSPVSFSLQSGQGGWKMRRKGGGDTYKLGCGIGKIYRVTASEKIIEIDN